MSTILNNDIARAIYLFSKDKTGHTFYADVVSFLNRKRLLGRSKDIFSKLEKIIDQEKGVIKAKVSSAVKLKKEDKENITQFLKHRHKAKEIVFIESLDPELISGFRLEANDEVIDMTMKNKIANLKEHLINAHE